MAIARISAAFVEDAQLSIFGERLRPDQSQIFIEHAHLSIFARGEVYCGFRLPLVPKMLNFPGVLAFAAVSAFKRAAVGP
jgi:hypothetical protein